nr:helix-turn-helix domain-containing protein [Clostridium cavendishii]
MCTKNTYGSKLRRLRLKKGLTLKKLSFLMNISSATLKNLEKDRIPSPNCYYYYYIYCNKLNVNHIDYLQLLTLSETSIQDKLLKIRAFCGHKTWKETSYYINVHSDTIHNWINNESKPTLINVKRIDLLLSKLKGAYN